MSKFPNDFVDGRPGDFDDEDVSKALQELLDLDKISMDWDEEAQEFIFYMTEAQKTRHDLEGDLYTEMRDPR